MNNKNVTLSLNCISVCSMQNPNTTPPAFKTSKLLSYGLLAMLSGLFFNHGAIAADHTADQWRFGTNAGLDFSSGSPVVTTAPGLDTLEGVATLADTVTGALLLYSDGITIWDKNNNPLPNGSGLLGHSSSTQSGVFIPSLDDPNIIYILTVGTTREYPACVGICNRELNYSIVDLSLNGGLGDVTQKNVLLKSPVAEKVSVVANAANDGYWVVAFEDDTSYEYDFVDDGSNDDIHIFELTKNGFSAPITYNFSERVSCYSGEAEFSNDGRYLANVHAECREVSYYDFNTTTGVVSNRRLMTSLERPWGLEFSPVNNYLWVSYNENRGLLQYDLSTNPTNTSAAQVSVLGSYDGWHSLEVAPDGKMYSGTSKGVHNASSIMDRIAAPDNTTAATIGLELAAITFPVGSYVRTGLPNAISGKVIIPPPPPPVCTSLTGDVSEIAAAIPFQVTSGDNVFVASNSPLPNSAGHLKAYSVQADGSIGTVVAWDAATLMNTAKRQNKLYSTNTSGTKILFNSLDTGAFVAGASPTVAKIKEYTLTPSIDSGAFLAGRANGSFLGAMSRGNDVALLTQMNNMGQFLADTAYRTFYNSSVSSRSEKILVSSDDGFLYAFDQSTGQLSWGWMPRTLAEELKDHTSFQSQGYMRGTVDIIDAKDSLGNYATYVVGSYKNGLGQYALKLNSSGGLDSVVWDQDYSGSNSEAPNHGEKDYFRDASDLTYVTYVVTNSSNQSTLVLREITTAATNTAVGLNFNATSTPFVMQDFGDSNDPAAKTLYLGDDSGNIKRTVLLTGGTLDSAANLKTALEGSSVGQLNAAEPILFLGASSSISGGLYYLRAQSESRLTLLSYNSGTTNWDKRWTSYVGGAGSWDTSNTYTADNSGSPTDDDSDGFFTNVTANGIQSLPADARITDAAQIVSNVVIVPVSVQAAGSCYGRAYFYVYNLTDGVFPDNKLFNPDSTKITGDIALGYGDPSRVNISDMPSNELMIGHGLTDQNISNNAEIDTSFLINDKLSTGIRGWKERRQE